MAQNFNIHARIQLQGPNNIRAVVRSIQSQLNTISANVTVNIASGTATRINSLNTNLQRVNASLLAIRTASDAANVSLVNLASTLRTVRGLSTRININVNARQATQQIHDFGGQAALAVRRFAAFAVPTTVFLGLVAAIKEGVSAAIDFEKEMIRLSQVTGKSVAALGELSGEITRLATSLGTSSKDLSIVATTIAQAGLNARDTKAALEALARSSLAATFTDIQQTTEGAIAVFRQFDVQAKDLQGVIGSLNSVSAQFAVESDDLVSVIRRTGGAFKASGGNLNELLGLFTAVRSTTRESADSIATGFRTIFTRIQRPRTIEFLKELGVSLQDAKGQFIGPLESIRRLNAALSEIPTTDPRFAAVIEELGGFRQVSKVIPLIQQFPEALKAISVAEQGQQSIVEDSITAQKSLANQIVKVKEEFLALFREITADKSLQFFVKEILNLAKGLIEVTRAVKPLIPLIGAIALVKGVQGGANLGGSFLSGLAGGGGRRRFAKGGKVPGSGNGDTVPAMLTPGEFVIRKKAAQSIGFDKLAKMNRFAQGGPVDEEFAIAALRPAGVRDMEDFPYSFTPKGAKKPITKQIHLKIHSLSSPTSEKLQGIFKNKVYSAVSQSADILQSSLGMERKQSVGIEKILKKSGLDQTIGNLFEGSLALAGAPYDGKEKAGSPIDFPSGLGPIADAFDLPKMIKTEAKATATSKDFRKKGRNLDNYLKNKYAVGDVSTAAKGKGSDILKPSADRVATKSFLDGLPEDKKAAVRGIIASIPKGQWRTEGARKLAPYKLQNLKEGFARGVNAIEFATGGKAPGSGNEDKVPALLTPGEFVINKRAAQKIGLSNLNRLNKSDKVQKFASGGRVRGLFSGAEGTGFALAGATSLLSSFVKLEGETQKVVAAFSGIATVSSGLSIALRSMADQTRLNQLKGSGFLLGGSNRSVLGSSTKFLAKNFDTLVTGISLASSALIVFGQTMQDSALANAKSAKTREDLDKAIKQDKLGSALSGAGVGAGIGAALGSVIPGIGTAVGAAVGAAVGGLAGLFSSNTKELVNAFSQAGFDRVDEKLGDAFDDFASKRTSLDTSALNIGQLSREQLNNVRNTSDPEKRAELTKQLKNNLVNFRTLSSAIVENVSSFEEFSAAYGGAGKTLVESIGFLTNKSFPELKKQIENEIEANKAKIESARQQAAANAQIKQFTISVRTLSDAFLNISDKINETGNSLDALISTIEGNSATAKFSAIPNDLFSRAASGGIQDVTRVSSAARQITATLDNNSINSIAESAISVTKLTNALPGILESVSRDVGLGGDTDRADELFRDAIDKLGGVSDQMKTVVKAIFNSELSSRESSGDAGFKRVAREDLVGLADKLVPEALKASVQELDKVNSSIQNIISTVSERLAKQSQIELSIAKQRAEIEDRIFEVSKLRLRANQEVSLSSVRANDARRRGILLGGAPALGAAGAGNRILSLVRARGQALDKANSAGAGTVAQKNAIVDFNKFDSEIQRLTAYMKDLASSTNELTLLQERLGKAEADRQAGKSLLEKLLYGDGKDRVKFSGAVQNIGQINAGKKNLIDLPKEQRDAVLELIREAPQNRASALFGGKKPEEFLNEQIRKDTGIRAGREGANVFAAQRAALELTTRTNEEGAIRAEMIKVQQASIDAETELAKVNKALSDQFTQFNNKLLSDFPGLIKNALIESAAANLQQQINVIDSKRAEVGGKLSTANNLSNFLGVDPKNLKVAGNAILENQDKFQKITDARKTFNLASDEKTFTFGLSRDIGQAARDAVKADSLDKKISLGGFVPRSSSISAENATAISKAVVDSSDSDILTEEFRQRLEKRLSKAIFEKSTVNARGRGDRFLVQNDSAQANAISNLVNEEIQKFTKEERDKSLRSGDNARADLESLLKGFFGNATSSIIDRLLDPKAFQDFSTAFSSIDTSIIGLANEFNALTLQLQQTNRTLAITNAQRVPIAPALPKASGGIVNGRSINSPMTTFTPRGTDKIPAILSRGEYVVNARAAKANLGTLDAMNFARGGYADMMAQRRQAYQAKKAAKKAAYDATTNEGKYGSNLSNRQYFQNLEAIRRNKRDNQVGSDRFGFKSISFGYENHLSENAKLLRKARELEKGHGPRGDFADVEGIAKRQVTGAIGSGIQGLFGLTKDFNRRISNYRYQGNNARIEAKYDSERGINKNTEDSNYGLFDDVGKIQYDRERKRLMGFASGGPVPGSGNRDSVPALLTPGEFVLNRRAAKSLGLHSLANFNQKFAKGGVVRGGRGGAGGVLNIDPAALAKLESFYSTFSDVINQFGSSISRFSEVGSSLTTALTSWGSSANQLAEQLASFPKDIQVNHSPIPVIVSVSGLEGLEASISDKVLSAVSDRMSVGKAKANDGKSPFFSNR